jgi:hypothetical protein
LPFVQGAVLALAPKLENGLTAEMMAQICGLARHELSQDQVTASLAERKIDISAGTDKNPQLALLVNGDRAGQATLCAAHLASSAFTMTELQPFLQSRSDLASLTLLLSVRLAIARANADVFALIAQEMQRRPGLTPMEIREQVQQLFSRLAPTYLARIRAQFPTPGTDLELVHLTPQKLAFTSSDGADFVLERGQISLRQNGVMVFGDGLLHGLSRILQVVYFDASATALLVPPNEGSLAQ